jgi:hypothetical protein
MLFRRFIGRTEHDYGGLQNVTSVLAWEWASVPLADGLDDDAELAKVVHVARPSRPGIVDGCAALPSGRNERQ